MNDDARKGLTHTYDDTAAMAIVMGDLIVITPRTRHKTAADTTLRNDIHLRYFTQTCGSGLLDCSKGKVDN